MQKKDTDLYKLYKDEDMQEKTYQYQDMQWKDTDRHKLNIYTFADTGRTNVALEKDHGSVSYTHLTLPTICSV
eukprot:12877373-Prorocentrum_lima.AAC.1